MESLNKVELKGTVGSKKITVVGDKKLANFSVATTYGYKDKDGNAIMETTWHRVNAWSGGEISEETLEKIDKLTPVHVIGRLRAMRYINADGNETMTYEILASKVEII